MEDKTCRRVSLFVVVLLAVVPLPATLDAVVEFAEELGPKLTLPLALLCTDYDWGGCRAWSLAAEAVPEVAAPLPALLLCGCAELSDAVCVAVLPPGADAPLEGASAADPLLLCLDCCCYDVPAVFVNYFLGRFKSYRFCDLAVELLRSDYSCPALLPTGSLLLPAPYGCPTESDRSSSVTCGRLRSD